MKLSLTLIVALSLLGAGLLVLILGGVYVGITYNQAANLSVNYAAKVKANEADFDNVTKVISQTSQVSKAQLAKLKDIYVSYAAARTGGGSDGAVMKWVQESIPNVDTSTMNNLQNIIVSSRNGWTERQKELVDVSREYNGLLARFPSNVVLGMFGFKTIDPLVVTSANTERAFESKQDNDTKLDL